jgi:hypothetical protein
LVLRASDPTHIFLPRLHPRREVNKFIPLIYVLAQEGRKCIVDDNSVVIEILQHDNISIVTACSRCYLAVLGATSWQKFFYINSYVLLLSGETGLPMLLEKQQTKFFKTKANKFIN